MNRRVDGAQLAGGSYAEQPVGTELEPLREQGWSLIHDWKKDRGGNVDHVVWSDDGAYAIETKSGGYSRRELGQARGNAAWAREKLGVRWVDPVLCMGEPPPQPVYTDGVWVMGVSDLGTWLASRPFGQARRAAV
jgi:Nuclease-related domain